MQSTRHRSLLRQMLAAILSSNLTTAELRILAREMRQGSLAEELSLLLERMMPLLADSSVSGARAESLDELENLIRHKRLSKLTLLNMMSSTGADPFRWADARTSTKVIIERFLSEASSSQLRKLLDTIDSSGPADEYLKGISDKRP